MGKKIAILLIFLAVIVSGFWLLSKRGSSTKVGQPASLQAVNENDQTLQAIAAVDEDFDGLNEADEKKYKTDPKNADTDADLLQDGDEVRKYKTNPLVADTDKDGVLDGLEVRRGLNPSGPGTLTN